MIQTRVWVWDSLVKAPPVTVHTVLCSGIASAYPGRLMVSGIDGFGVCLGFFVVFLFVCSWFLLLLFFVCLLFFVF